tara:strand:- start:255 stop:1088 length:834 start_codon:yes stop_codon:yes gene_type:complete
MLAEFIYCYLLRPWPLRQLANWTIRQLLPKSVRRGDATIVLNPRDPVVSGALYFGVYEKAETAFIQRTLKSGMTVLDVGANIGYYTALAARRVGPNGRVIALEPDPESYEFLQQTIAANEVGNVDSFQCAAAERKDSMTLYISHDNRGDNRLYEPDPRWPKVTVPARPADDVLKEAGIDTIDFIKIDVQGFEASVIAGLKTTLDQSPNLTLITEFWPQGLRDAGSDPRDYLKQLRAHGLQLHELNAKGGLAELADDDQFIARYPGRRYTNLIGRKTK